MPCEAIEPQQRLSREPPEPLKLEWSVAIVSEDETFIETIKQMVSPRELKVLPPSRAEEAPGFDLVIVGWDALPTLSRNAELVPSLVSSSRVLAAAEPGEDALTILLSGVVEPVKLGEKGTPKHPFAFCRWSSATATSSPVAAAASRS